MKAFLQGLLIVISLGLCAVISVLWVRETHSNTKLQNLTNTIQDKSEMVLNLESAVRRNEAEIIRLDALKVDLQNNIKSNIADIKRLDTDLSRTKEERDGFEQAVNSYKDALQKANENINRQNDAIKEQNTAMQKMAEERNGIVEKFNKLAAEHNELVLRWNKQQEELAAAATNQPAQKQK